MSPFARGIDSWRLMLFGHDAIVLCSLCFMEYLLVFSFFFKLLTID